MAGLLLYSSTVDITPPEALPLGGYTSRNGAKFVDGGQRLMARTRILGDIAFVSVEMLTIPESLIAEVRARVPRDLKVFLIATHTHCAPDSQMLNERMTFPIPGIATYRKRWLTWYSDKISEGIIEAKESDPKIVKKITLKRAHVAQVRSRRTGPVDNMVNQITVQGDDFSEIFLTIFGAHPTLLDESVQTLQGDWPGEVLRQTSGLVATGLIGNASPIPYPFLPILEQPHFFAETLLKNVSKNTEKLIWSEGEVLSSKKGDFQLPSPVPHPTFAGAYRVTQPMAESVIKKFATNSIEINTIQIGKVTIRTIGGEPTAEFGRKLFGNSDLIISHANGWAGYMLTPEDYARGGYEATLALNGPDVLAKLKAQITDR